MLRNLTRLQSIMSSIRMKSSSTIPPEVTIYLDKNTILCWHPEQPFPYEYTKPLPQIDECTDVLKIGKKEIAQVFKQTTPLALAEELGKLTQTTKHRWFPNNRKLRRKKTEGYNRKYL